MTGLAVWLFVLAAGDLLRARSDATSRPRLVMIAAIGAMAVLAAAVSAHPSAAGWVGWCAGAGTVAVWVMASGAPRSRGESVASVPDLRPAQGADRSSGASDVTEYFLIGSFASWLVAFGGIALGSL